MIDRDELAARNMTALLSNPGGPIQPNPASGWGYVNCGAADVATIAVGLADALLSALAVPPAAPAPSPTSYVPKVGDVVVGLFGPDDGKLARVDSTDPLSWSLWCDGAWWSGYGFTVTKDARPATSSERAAAGLPVDESAGGWMPMLRVEKTECPSCGCRFDAIKAPAFDEAQEREAARRAWYDAPGAAIGTVEREHFVMGWIARARVAAKGGA